MPHHADNLKIRIDYFRPRRAAKPATLSRRGSPRSHSTGAAMHVSVLSIMMERYRERVELATSCRRHCMARRSARTPNARGCSGTIRREQRHRRRVGPSVPPHHAAVEA